MRGRSSARQGGKREMEIDNKLDHKFKEETQTHLSGAYIRSLVKQLTASRTKDPESLDGDGFPLGHPHHPKLAKFGEDSLVNGEAQPPPHPPQPQKKQVRRRLHTSRPYQERLLNMAEARREIVTALKFHRAAMKQANEQHQAPPQPLPPPPQSPPPLSSQEGKLMKSRRNPRIYPSSNSNFHPNFGCSSSSLPSTYLPWPGSQIAPPPISENLNVSLPNQTLGLNLNFQDFNNLDANLYHNSNNNYCASFHSSSLSPSSSSSTNSFSLSPTITSIVTQQGFPGPAAVSQDGTHHHAHVMDPAGGGDGRFGLHQAMGDEEMAEIRWIGEQHEMEWNDTVNLVTSAWWFKYLKTVEIGPDEREREERERDHHHLFEEAMEFPDWLNANENMHQHCLSDEYYSQDTALPCMDLGEIEGMDGDWLA